MTDTPSTLEERAEKFIEDKSNSGAYDLAGYIPDEVNDLTKFVKQELQRFASEVEKILENEFDDDGLSITITEKEQELDTLKHHYGLMEGEKV